MVNFLNSMAEDWWAWQFAMLWQTAVLVGIVWILDIAIRKWAHPQVRYALWMLVLVKLLIGPTWTSPASVTSHIPDLANRAATVMERAETQTPLSPTISGSNEKGVSLASQRGLETGVPLPSADAEQIDTNRTSAVMERTESVTKGQTTIAGSTIPNKDTTVMDRTDATGPVIAVDPKPSLTWHVYAMLIWLVGMVVLGGWLFIRLSGLRKVHFKDGNAHRLPERFYQQLETVADRLRLKRIPRVILTDKVACPAVFGVFKPVLLMPAAKFKTMSMQDTEHILLHELAHIKRGDLLVHAIWMCVQIVYWFNPLLWMARRPMQNLRELCCDATVARLLRDKTYRYRETLLETARQLLAEPVDPGLGLLGLFENNHWLVTRLQWLEKKTWKNRPLRIAAITLIIAVMTTFVLPMAKAKSLKIGFFDRRTLIKFEHKDKPRGDHRKTGNETLYSKTYDVVFRKGEKLLVYAELYQSGKPMRHLGHKIFDGNVKPQELTVKLTEKSDKKYKVGDVASIFYQVQIEMGQENLSFETELTAPYYANTDWGWWQGQDINGKQPLINQLLTFERRASGQDQRLRIWMPGWDITQVSKDKYTILIQMIPVSQVSQLKYLSVFGPIIGDQLPDGSIFNDSGPHDDKPHQEKYFEYIRAMLVPLPALTAHRYYKADEPIKIEMRQQAANWKPSLDEFFDDYENGDNPFFILVNEKEYEPSLMTGPFGGTTQWITLPPEAPRSPGKYTFAYGWKNLNVIDPDKSDEPMHFDRLMTNEVEFEVVNELPEDYYQQVYEDGWDEILDANLEPWFTDDFQSVGVAGVLIGLKVTSLPFDIAFDVYAQAEDMAQPKQVAQQLARKSNSTGNYLFWIKPPSLTWDNVGQKRWRIILKPSQKAAAEHPPIRNYYGREFTTDWLTFEKSKQFDQHREMFDKSKDQTDSALSKEELTRDNFFNAVREGNLPRVKQFVAQGFDVNTTSVGGPSALHEAGPWGQTEIARFLIEHGADVHLQDRHQRTALSAAAAYSHQAEPTAKLLIENGADVTLPDDRGMTPLHYACTASMCRMLVEKGADIHARDDRGWTPLHYDSNWGRLSAVQYLVENGADIDALDNEGLTPLMLASANACSHIAEYLINQHAGLSVTDKQGRTPLHWAVLKNEEQIRERLNGERAGDGQSQAAVDKHYLKIIDTVKILIAAGADLKAKDAQGLTALDYARTANNLAAANLLSSEEEAQNSELTTTNYKATLPNGVTVELVGIYDCNDPDGQWWSPDRTTPILEPCLYNEAFSQLNAVAFQLSGKEYSQHYWLDDPLITSDDFLIRPAGPPENKMGDKLYNMRLLLFPPETKDTISFKVGTPNEQWEDVVENFIYKTEKFEKNNEAYISATFFGGPLRVLAVDNDSNLHPTNKIDSIPLTTSSSAGYSKATFKADLPLDQIKEFRFQTCSYEWIIFKNVALRPGGETAEQRVIPADLVWTGIPEGWGREELWPNLIAYLKQNAVIDLPGCEIRTSDLSTGTEAVIKGGQLHISYKTTKYTVERPTSKSGQESELRTETGPQPDGLMMRIWLSDGAGQLSRPQTLNRTYWKLYATQIYLPELKMYLFANIEYGDKTNQSILSKYTDLKEWLKNVTLRPGEETEVGIESSGPSPQSSGENTLPIIVNDPHYVSRFSINTLPSETVADAFTEEDGFDDPVGFVIHKGFNDEAVHCIDFDTERIIQLPETVNVQDKEAIRRWAESEGIDALIHLNRLTTVNMATVGINEEQWTNLYARTITELNNSELTSGTELAALSGGYFYHAFKSSSGRIGIVGLSFQNGNGTEPHRLLIKYKLQQSGGETAGGFGGDPESLYMKVREAVPVRHEGNPSLQLTKAVHDFGQVGPGTESKAVFDFKNVGTGTLEVYGAQATCGCLNPTFILPLLIPQALNSIENKSLSKDNPLFLQPGESARLEVEFTVPSSKGKIIKYLYLLSNDPVNPKSQLEIIAETIVKVEVSPEQVDLLLDQANGGMKEILLKSVDGRAFSIQEIKTPDSVMTIPFDPKIKARQFLLEATVNVEKLAQSPAGAIQITTDHPQGGQQLVRYNALPYYEVSNPRLILQSVSPEQEIIRQVMVRGNYGKTVKIKSAQSRNGYMKIVNQQGSGEQVQLEIAVTPPKQDKRYLTDELTIITEDGHELIVRCSGWYKMQDGQSLSGGQTEI